MNMSSAVNSGEIAANRIRSRGPPKWLGRFWNWIESQIPTGYDDETGFHTGVDPLSARCQRPVEIPAETFDAVQTDFTEIKHMPAKNQSPLAEFLLRRLGQSLSDGSGIMVALTKKHHKHWRFRR